MFPKILHISQNFYEFNLKLYQNEAIKMSKFFNSIL